MVTTDGEIAEHLSAVYDELVELIGETKQAAWTASSERRQVFHEFWAFLAEQVVMVDDAALRLGGRASSVTSPTAHRPRNIAAAAGGDPQRLVELLAVEVRHVVEDVRHRVPTVDGEVRTLLSDMAEQIDRHVELMRHE